MGRNGALRWDEERLALRAVGSRVRSLFKANRKGAIAIVVVVVACGGANVACGGAIVAPLSDGAVYECERVYWSC